MHGLTRPSSDRPIHMKPLWLALLLPTACAPALTQQQTTPIVPNATARTLAYGPYTTYTYYETLSEGEPVVLVYSIGGGSIHSGCRSC